MELFPRSVWTSFLPICQDPKSAWVLSKGSSMNWTLILWLLPLLNQTWILFDFSFEKSGILNLKAMGYLQKQWNEKKSCWEPGGSGSLVDLAEVSIFEEIHFWFANFFTRKNSEIENLHWLSGHFSENPLSMCRIPLHTTFLSHSLFEQPLMHNCELLQFTVKNLVVLYL